MREWVDWPYLGHPTALYVPMSVSVLVLCRRCLVCCSRVTPGFFPSEVASHAIVLSFAGLASANQVVSPSAYRRLLCFPPGEVIFDLSKIVPPWGKYKYLGGGGSFSELLGERSARGVVPSVGRPCGSTHTGWPTSRIAHKLSFQTSIADANFASVVMLVGRDAEKPTQNEEIHLSPGPTRDFLWRQNDPPVGKSEISRFGAEKAIGGGKPCVPRGKNKTTYSS